MDIDETKKRKVEEVPEPERLDLDLILKQFVESSNAMAKLLQALAQKVILFEKLFNKDLFNKD